MCYSYHIGEDKQELAEYSLLDPTWLTKALYAVIREGIDYAEYGIVSTDRIIHILGQDPVNQPMDSEYTRPRYEDEEECQYIFDVAEAHDLCFRMGKDYLFFPALCKDETPLDEFPDQTAYGTPIQYRLKYQYLPDSVVHKLMVRCYKKEMTVKRCWFKGMILSAANDFKAVVRMNDDEKTLAIDIYANIGVDAMPFVLFKTIREQILDINHKLGLTADENIICGEDTFSVVMLEAAYEDNGSVYGDKTSKKYNPAELLGRFFKPTVVQYENGETKQIFLINKLEQYNVDIKGGVDAPVVFGPNGTINIAIDGKSRRKEKKK